MMPLSFANEGYLFKVVMVKGNPDAKKHLEDIGFVPDSEVNVISKQGGSVIVNVKNTRVAIGNSMAAKIMVEECAI